MKASGQETFKISDEGARTRRDASNPMGGEV